MDDATETETTTNATMDLKYECVPCSRTWTKTIVAVDGMYELSTFVCAGCLGSIRGIVMPLEGTILDD